MSSALHAFSTPTRSYTKLIKMLKRAHAIEVGAYFAYEGHCLSTKPLTSAIRGKIKFIQIDEKIHRQEVARMLSSIGEQQDFMLDAMFYLIGRTISALCYVMPAHWSNLGAAMMERMADPLYADIAIEAHRLGNIHMAGKLLEMRKTEIEHEEFFKTLIEEHRGSSNPEQRR